MILISLLLVTKEIMSTKMHTIMEDKGHNIPFLQRGKETPEVV